MITNMNTVKKAEIEFDALSSYEDIIPNRIFDIEDLSDKLLKELEENLLLREDYYYDDMHDEYYGFPIKHEEAYYDLIKLRINILKRFTGVLNPKQLFAIGFYINIEAKEFIRPGDRKREIIKEINRSSELDKFGIANKDEFIEFLESLDPIVFYELTEILLKSRVIGYCQVDQPNKLKKKLEILNQ